MDTIATKVLSTVIWPVKVSVVALKVLSGTPLDQQCHNLTHQKPSVTITKGSQRMPKRLGQSSRHSPSSSSICHRRRSRTMSSSRLLRHSTASPIGSWPIRFDIFDEKSIEFCEKVDHREHHLSHCPIERHRREPQPTKSEGKMMRSILVLMCQFALEDDKKKGKDGRQMATIDDVKEAARYTLFNLLNNTGNFPTPIGPRYCLLLSFE